MNRIARKCQRPAFTLIELLVTVAIIALLVGLLVPALSGARRKAIMVKCQTNMRLTAQAINNYTEQFQNKYPDADAFPWGVTQPDINQHSSCLPHRIHRVHLTPDDPSRIYAAWYCPVKAQAFAISGHGTYAYNARDLAPIGPSGFHIGVPQSKLPQVSTIGLIRECTATDALRNLPQTSDNRDLYGAPHDGGQNIAYLDTHVEFTADKRWLEWNGNAYVPPPAEICRFPYWKAGQTP